MRLSENFYLREFTKLSELDITAIQKYLLKTLCKDVLQPIRNFLGCSIRVTSGLRTLEDMQRLKMAGYNPSDTSDHYFGATVPLLRARKIARFGGFYSYSVGAADIIPECGAEVAFGKLKRYFNPITGEILLPNQIVKVGQLILEYGNTYWMHASNPALLVYSKKFSQKFLKKSPFLISLDNGKTYQPVT